MQLMQRLGCNYSDEYIDAYLEEILAHPGSCDNVWIPTPYGFPTMEVHKENVKKWASVAEKFRANGISVSLQVSNTIGHGQYMVDRDNTGLIYEGSPARRLVGHDGTVAEYCFCWKGQYFQEYLLEMLSHYAQLKPEYIWVDDDFRAINHAPVGFGCFCDRCIQEFNEKYESSFTRESLVQEILYGDLKWREKHIEFIRESLASLMLKIGETIHRISPDTALASQHGAYGAYSGHGFDHVYDAMKTSTGKVPASRPGGGNYNDHNPSEILKKAIYLNWQNAMLPEYVIRKCPEIENLPFVVFGKTPAGTAFETTHYFANGNTDMTYSMLMELDEPMEWHGQEFALFSKHRKYWDRLSEYNLKSHQAGIQYFMPKETWKKKLAPEETIQDLNREPWYGLTSFVRDAIPIAYDKQDTSVICLHPDVAKVISEKELQYLLEKSVLTDGESISILTKRGYDFGLSTEILSFDDALRVYEVLEKHPVNPKHLSTHKSSYFSEGRKAVYTMEVKENAKESLLDFSKMEILGTYAMTAGIPPFTENPERPYGIADMIVPTKRGGKWAVLGYAPWKHVIPTYKRDQLLDIADYISDNGLCARLLTAVQAVLLPRKNQDGKTVCVSITNCTIGESGELKLLIRNPVGEKFVFMSQYDGEKILDFEKDGEAYILNIPSLHPWSVGTVFIEE